MLEGLCALEFVFASLSTAARACARERARMPRYNTPTRGSPARAQQHTKDAEYHHALGLEFAAVGRYEKASEHFEKAMNMEPSNEAHPRRPPLLL